MSPVSLNNLGSYLQSILGTAPQNTGVSSVNASTLQLQPDNSQLSPFAQLMSTLQQLQQSDPAKYQQVTQQIATNLQSAAQTAQADGNTAAASQLSQLSTDFTNASQSGQLPNIQDLAQSVGGGGHHHHHHGHAASSSDSTSLLSAFQTTGSQSESLNPMGIIMNTLSSAGS